MDDSDSSEKIEISREILEIMNQEGSEILDRMHSHNDVLQSKNLGLLGFVLAVLSIVSTFIFAEGSSISQSNTIWLLSGYFLLSICSIACGIIVFRPKKYGEIFSFDEPYFWENMEEKDAMRLYWNLSKAKKKAIGKCKETHEKDVKYFRFELYLFIISIGVLLLFLIGNAHS